MLTPEHVRPCMLPLNRDQRFDSHTHTCTNMHSRRLRIENLVLFRHESHNGNKRDFACLSAASQPFTHSPAAWLGVCMYVCVLH